MKPCARFRSKRAFRPRSLRSLQRNATEEPGRRASLQTRLIDAQVQEILLQAELDFQKAQLDQPVEISDAELDAEVEPQLREPQWQLAGERQLLESDEGPIHAGRKRTGLQTRSCRAACSTRRNLPDLQEDVRGTRTQRAGIP